jgi:hypothetical protein
MPKKDWMPGAKPKVAVFMNNFAMRLDEQKTVLGVPDADVVKYAGLKDDWLEKLNEVEAARTAYEQLVSEQDALRDQLEAQLRPYVQVLKHLPAYTPAIGELLGIEGAEFEIDLSIAKPDIAGTPKPGGNVVVTFVKSTAHGVNIYSKRENDADFVFLARDTTSPYIDTRPCLVPGKPEKRFYKAIYVFNDAEVGLFSDIVDITCLV